MENFEKSVIIYHETPEVCRKFLLILYNFMINHNKEENINLTCFSIRTKAIEKTPFALEMIINWYGEKEYAKK